MKFEFFWVVLFKYSTTFPISFFLAEQERSWSLFRIDGNSDAVNYKLVPLVL